jgi:hypothetical protein
VFEECRATAHKLLVLDGKSAKPAGGLPSGPILSRLSQREIKIEKCDFNEIFVIFTTQVKMHLCERRKSATATHVEQ